MQNNVQFPNNTSMQQGFNQYHNNNILPYNYQYAQSSPLHGTPTPISVQRDFSNSFFLTPQSFNHFNSDEGQLYGNLYQSIESFGTLKPQQNTYNVVDSSQSVISPIPVQQNNTLHPQFQMVHRQSPSSIKRRQYSYNYGSNTSSDDNVLMSPSLAEQQLQQHQRNTFQSVDLQLHQDINSSISNMSQYLKSISSDYYRSTQSSQTAHTGSRQLYSTQEQDLQQSIQQENELLRADDQRRLEQYGNFQINISSSSDGVSTGELRNSSDTKCLYSSKLSNSISISKSYTSPSGSTSARKDNNISIPVCEDNPLSKTIKTSKKRPATESISKNMSGSPVVNATTSNTEVDSTSFKTFNFGSSYEQQNTNMSRYSSNDPVLNPLRPSAQALKRQVLLKNTRLQRFNSLFTESTKITSITPAMFRRNMEIAKTSITGILTTFDLDKQSVLFNRERHTFDSWSDLDDFFTMNFTLRQGVIYKIVSKNQTTDVRTLICLDCREHLFELRPIKDSRGILKIQHGTKRLNPLDHDCNQTEHFSRYQRQMAVSILEHQINHQAMRNICHRIQENKSELTMIPIYCFLALEKVLQTHNDSLHRIIRLVIRHRLEISTREKLSFDELNIVMFFSCLALFHVRLFVKFPTAFKDLKYLTKYPPEMVLNNCIPSGLKDECPVISWLDTNGMADIID